MSIYDPIEPDDHAWFPADFETSQLVVCLQACKAVTREMRSLAPDAPLSDKHGLALLATPTISLLDNVDQLFRALGQQDKSAWPTKDQQNLKKYARSIRKHKQGRLRRIRSQMSAHHDAKALGRGGEPLPRVSAELVLLPICEALFVLTLLLNHNEVYRWTRSPTLGQPDIVQILPPGAVLAESLRVEPGHPVELIGAQLTRDPRWDAREVIEAAAAEYNRLVDLTPATLPHLTLSRRP